MLLARAHRRVQCQELRSGAPGSRQRRARRPPRPRLPRAAADGGDGGAGGRLPGVCVFVNDRLDGDVLARVAAGGTRFVALRCAGFNNVDLAAARRHRHHRGARPRLLAPRRRRARLGARVDARSQAPSGGEPGARGELLSRRAAGVRAARTHHRRGRHRPHRGNDDSPALRLRGKAARLRSGAKPRLRLRSAPATCRSPSCWPNRTW